MPTPALPRDPRWFQIAFLGSFLAVGVYQGVVPTWEPPLTIAAALLAQLALGRWKKLPAGHWMSGAITGLGLTILLRSDEPWLPPLVAALAIASKFVLRVRGKHVFNPANLGVAGAMLATTHAWCSPSQWGEDTVQLLWFVALGLAVVFRAMRSDISFAFLLAHVLLKTGRVLWLGQRVQVLFHQLSIASLIVFTFFMISDPKTTPDHRAGRVVYAGLVAVLAFVLQHHFWIMNSPIWALFALSPLVPLIDWLARSERYQWPAAPQSVPASTRPVGLAVAR
jgi:Na+-transporting NADH:ubiquinone oxidoreductase subunit NqrB